jgi:prepilin signal peptidase PulO-like enzyme (type II secretory pathway)
VLFIDIYIIVIGLFIGSFFNVVAIRLLKKESFVYPPSHCPQCQHSLSPLDLVPVFSYLFLKGKCRYCQNNISYLYPLGELLTAISFFAVYKHIGFNLELIPAVIFASVLVLAVLTDIREKLILDKIILPSLIILVIIRLFIGEYSFWYYSIGGVVGFLLLLLIAVLSKGGMGGGDIKLYAVIGIVLGPWLTLISLVFASLFGAIIGLFLIAIGKATRKQAIPFAPFIWIGSLLSYLYGFDIWEWYINVW